MTLDLDAIEKRLAGNYGDGEDIDHCVIADVEDLVAEVKRLRADVVQYRSMVSAHILDKHAMEFELAALRDGPKP